MTASPRQLAALCAVADTLSGSGVRWVLAGSAGRALLGCPVRPADIDIEVPPEQADTAARAFGLTAGESSGGGRRSRRGRAWRAGVEVDITSDLAIDGPALHLPADFALQWERSHPGDACGRAIRVAPVEEAICRAIVLDDWSALAKVAAQAAGAAPAIPLRASYVALRLSSATEIAAR